MKVLQLWLIIYSSILTPERMDSRKYKSFWGTTFYFPQSKGELSAERSEARWSRWLRIGKSWHEESFVLSRIQYLSLRVQSLLNKYYGSRAQYSTRILDKTVKYINEFLTGWKSMHQMFKIYFAWNPRLKGIEFICYAA